MKYKFTNYIKTTILNTSIINVITPVTTTTAATTTILIHKDKLIISKKNQTVSINQSQCRLKQSH